jgi:hypothetical protein
MKLSPENFQMIGKLSLLGLRQKLLQSAVFIAVAIFVTIYAQDRGIAYKEVIVGLSLSIFAVIMFGGERGIRFGFVLWVLTLALGYRTIAVSKDLAIHPSELLLWLLLACICAQRSLLASARLTFPIWLWMLMPFWVLAWWPLISGVMRWDKMLNEFRNFVLFIPLMIVASVVLQWPRYWRYLLLAFFFASSFIACMGILEYWFPEVANLFPSFVGTTAKRTITEEGFVRAQFTFWGSAAATFICVLALPLGIILTRWWPLGWQKMLILFASVMQLLAIYIGGYRSIWLLLLVQALTASLLRLRKQGALIAALCILISVGGYELIPRTTERAISGIAALQGKPTDSSATGRKNRALGALESTIEAPFGTGWSSAGWVHSDFLQVSVNLGVIPGLIFFGGCIFTFVRLGRRVLPMLRSGENADLGISLLVSFIALTGILAMEGITVLPQTVLPVWFVWVLAEVWLRQTALARELSLAFVTPPYPYKRMQVQLLSRLNRMAGSSPAPR